MDKVDKIFIAALVTFLSFLIWVGFTLAAKEHECVEKGGVYLQRDGVCAKADGTGYIQLSK